ncbi:MAG: hypothetical protein U9N48_02145 [Euryarchaeota archaeon]|nr:hypothetical protein [Euryarchaeota archaeon]
MIDYIPTEIDIIDLKINKPDPIEGDILLKYPAGITLAIPSMIIKDSLDIALKYEMNLDH